MYYYIINNSIWDFDSELDSSLYSYQKLTSKQAEFYELHRCSVQEVLNEKLHEPYIPSIDELKLQKIEYFSRLAFEKRAEKIPEYKVINAGLGVYSDTENDRIKAIVQSFRTEFYRLKALIEAVDTIEELNAIQDNYEGLQ